MKEYQMDFKALKSKVGIDDIAISLGYQIDRKAGLGRYVEFVLPDSAGGRKDTIIVKPFFVVTDKEAMLSALFRKI